MRNPLWRHSRGAFRSPFPGSTARISEHEKRTHGRAADTIKIFAARYPAIRGPGGEATKRATNSGGADGRKKYFRKKKNCTRPEREITPVFAADSSVVCTVYVNTIMLMNAV